MHERLWLLADVGATYARLVLFDPESGTRSHEQISLVRDHPTFEEALQSYMAQYNACIKGLAIAIACPVLDDHVQMTNHGWGFSQRQLKHSLRLDACLVVNDLEAAAQAIPLLPASVIEPIGPTIATHSSKPKGLVAPGSGLGTAGLFPVKEGWKAFASEGGHVSLFEMEDPRLVASLKTLYGHVSPERLISGHGLVNLYSALYEIEHGDTPNVEGMSASSLASTYGSDPFARKAVDEFSHLLGAFAGNFALTLGALGGMYFAGGALRSLGTTFDHQIFRRAFEAKGRFTAYLQKIPTFLITHPCPAFCGLQTLVTTKL